MCLVMWMLGRVCGVWCCLCVRWKLRRLLVFLLLICCRLMWLVLLGLLVVRS